MKKAPLYTLPLLLVITLLAACGTSRKATTGTQGASYSAYGVAFYNIENLFDTHDDPSNTGDDEFLPTGSYRWTEGQYQKKLNNIAHVISQLGREQLPYGVGAIGIAEVENAQVLHDLVARPALQDMHLQVLHEEGPDHRGIDVALLYNPSIFKLQNHNYHRYPALPDKPDYRTRNQLLASGTIGGEKLHLIVCHWPSRYGGAESSYLRETAAQLTLHIMDSLYQVEPNAKIIVMGDLNDDPDNKSVAEVLQAKMERSDVPPRGLYNPAWKLHAQGIGTLGYQGKWNFFDQMLISHSLLNPHYQSLSFWKMEVFNRPFLIRQEGKNKGYPHRTFEGRSFINGYSDHFPVITYLLRQR